MSRVRAKAAEIASEFRFASERFNTLISDVYVDRMAATANLRTFEDQHGLKGLLKELEAGRFDRFGRLNRPTLAERMLGGGDAVNRQEASRRARQELPAAISDLTEKTEQRDEAARALRQAELAAEAERRQEEVKRSRIDPAPSPDVGEGEGGGRPAPRQPREPSAPLSRKRSTTDHVKDWSTRFAERQMAERGIDAEELQRRQLEREKAREQDPSPNPSRSGRP